MMTFKNINDRFTEIVNDYLAAGYTINLGTMSGMQSEIAKVDLTNGKEIIRVRLEHSCLALCSTMVIIVGRAERKIRPNRCGMTSDIWNQRLEEIYKETFYGFDEMGYHAFGTEEEMEKCRELRRERGRSAYEPTVVQVEIPEAALKIALNYIRRKYYSSYTLKDIEGVFKETYRGNTKYYIRARGKAFWLS